MVASMGPLNHVSRDYGATWHTYDPGGSEPFQTVFCSLREPITSALPDGRIVTGYMQFWVAHDASNTSFRATTAFLEYVARRGERVTSTARRHRFAGRRSNVGPISPDPSRAPRPSTLE